MRMLCLAALMTSTACASSGHTEKQDGGCRRTLTRCFVIENQIVCEAVEDECEAERWEK